MENLELLSRNLEHFETPRWAAEAILKKEILTHEVYDPCCGTGILGEAALKEGYEVFSYDCYHWGYEKQKYTENYLEINPDLDFRGDHSVIMNPPFSKACEFVEKSFDLGARKILCFQRLAWLESKDRRRFWDQAPLAKVYLCAERATCWRHDLPKDENGKRFDPKTGKKLAETPTAHAWFVFEKGYNGAPQFNRLYKK